MSTPNSSHSRRGGFTLIEVAIALALFVIGALAIVRIFPPALSVIRNNESRVTATQMGEATLARLRNRYSPPPEAVFDVDNSGNWQDYPGAVVGTVNRNNSLPKSPIESDFSNSALAHFRYVYGEPHRISPGQSILLNYPQDTTVPNIGFFVDKIIEGVQLNSNGYLDFANAYYADSPDTPFRGTGVTDPADATTLRPPNNMRGADGVVYYVSYRWRECLNSPGCTSFSEIKSANEEPLNIPRDEASYSTSTDARVLACAPPNSANRAIPGTVQLRVRQTSTVPPSAISSSIGPDSSRKIVSVKNIGSGAITVSFNYLASDWRNLINDSAPSNNLVRLPISGIDETTIFGVLTNSDQTITPSLALPDLSTKDKVAKAKKGEVEFTASSSVTAARIRTIYNTFDGWTHQLSVAPRYYVAYNASRGVTLSSGNINFPREPWREYHWSSGDPSVIYFHPSEAGKSVALTFLNSSNVKVNSICSIEDDLIAQPGSVANGFIGPGNTTTSKVARLFITDAVGNEIPANSILAVQGLSVRARTAWLNNDRYNQVIVPGYRSLTQSR